MRQDKSFNEVFHCHPKDFGAKITQEENISFGFTQYFIKKGIETKQ